MHRDYLLAFACLALTGIFIGSAPTPPADRRTASAGDAVLTFSGHLTFADYERVIEHPFDVPAGAVRIDIDLQYTGRDDKTVLDLGLRGPSSLRGWSGGRETRVHVSTLTASPGYLPGPIEAGTWRAVIGVPNIRKDSRSDYTLTVRVSRTLPVVRREPLRSGPGWYAGDLHLHTGHSDGSGKSTGGVRIPAPVHRVLDRAAGADLDFVVLTDHNTAAHWLDIERLQPFYDSLLLVHGREITTYRGHANAMGERGFTDFTLADPRAPLLPMLGRIVADGAFLSINHPLRPDDERCMGCGWNDSSDEAMRAVHGVEVVNGEDWRIPQLYGWPYWVEALNRGHRLALVGGSDDHTPEDDQEGRAGVPTTVVQASELSEPAIIEGLKQGRTYLRVAGGRTPTLDLSATVDGRRYALGDTVPVAAGQRVRAELRATVIGAEGHQLRWIRRGNTIGEARLDRLGTATATVDAGSGDWFSLVVVDGERPMLLSGAIYVGGR